MSNTRKRHPKPPFYIHLEPNPSRTKPHTPFMHVIAETISADGTEYSLHATKGYRRKRVINE